MKDFEESALRLARSPALLLRLRQRLANAVMTGALFDTGLLTRQLERGYAAMWELFQADGLGAWRGGEERGKEVPRATIWCACLRSDPSSPRAVRLGGCRQLH